MANVQLLRKTAIRYHRFLHMLAKEGDITEEMMYNTFNMGLGMIVAVDPADVDKTMEAIRAGGRCTLRGRKNRCDGEKGVDLC